MKKYTYLLSLLAVVACSQQDNVQEKAMAKVAQEDAMIAKYTESVRLEFFYIPDVNDPATNETNLTKESKQAFINKSRFFHNGKLKETSLATFGQQYKTFLKENKSNPYLRPLRRETAEEVMASKQSLSVQDQTFFAQELVSTRSDDVKLIMQSILSLRGKISKADEEQLIAKAKVLLNQYEKAFSDDLAEAEKAKGTTYRQKATYAINAEFARQGLELVRDNRRLLEQG